MGAVPKRRISGARRGHRRSKWTLDKPKIAECPQCGAPKRPHHVCLNCGTYRGVQVLEVVEE